MKANEAPEKIYLIRTTRIIDEWRKEPSQYGHNIEYTRTDAFIEKACQWLDEIYISQECLSLDDIEEFKKYMKGK